MHLRTRHFATVAVLLLCAATTATAQFARQPAPVLHQHASAAVNRPNLRQFEQLPNEPLRRKATPVEAPAAPEVPQATAADQQTDELDASVQSAHSRQKRMIWITDDGRLALPPGTVLSISPTISLPLVRYPPTGFLSNMTMSFPLTIDFDKLGLTDNENPLGVLPPVFARSMGRSIGSAAGSMLSNYVGQYLHIRKRRDASAQQQQQQQQHQQWSIDDEQPAELPESHRHVFHGGERAILYGVVEDMIATFGFNGKACMLRAICEMHSKAVHQYGLFGEMAKLFFTASKSKYSDMLPEYVRAEKIGEGTSGPGECFPYYKDCPRSIFKTGATKRYSAEEAEQHNDAHHQQADVDGEHDAVVHLQENEINDINGMATDERFRM